jgi:hypothetical protein
MTPHTPPNGDTCDRTLHTRSGTRPQHNTTHRPHQPHHTTLVIPHWYTTTHRLTGVEPSWEREDEQGCCKVIICLFVFCLFMDDRGCCLSISVPCGCDGQWQIRGATAAGSADACMALTVLYNARRAKTFKKCTRQLVHVHGQQPEPVLALS